MSLSFVKSAVLSSTDGVSHNEEVNVESTETEALRRRGTTKSLFAQLQENKDIEAEKTEAARNAMREAMTLNDEDCAHLDAIEEAREARKKASRRLEEEEVEVFRAAKSFLEMSREEAANTKDAERLPAAEISVKDIIRDEPPAVKGLAAFVPKIVGKKRRRSVATTADTSVENENKLKKLPEKIETTVDTKKKSNTKDGSGDDDGGAFGSLLDYGDSGSDSD